MQTFKLLKKSCVVCNEHEPTPSLGKKAVGIDLDISNFCTDSDGLAVAHSKNVKKSEKQLAKQQEKPSHKT